MKIKVCEISGMGGRDKHGYEWGCQIVCIRAVHFLSKLNGKVPKYEILQNIIGLVKACEPAAKELDEYILLHPLLREYGMTGAMHQYGLAHAFKIHLLGRDGYLSECAKHREAKDFYEMEEDEAFPPEAPRL